MGQIWCSRVSGENVKLTRKRRQFVWETPLTLELPLESSETICRCIQFHPIQTKLPGFTFLGHDETLWRLLNLIGNLIDRSTRFNYGEMGSRIKSLCHWMTEKIWTKLYFIFIVWSLNTVFCRCLPVYSLLKIKDTVGLAAFLTMVDIGKRAFNFE